MPKLMAGLDLADPVFVVCFSLVMLTKTPGQRPAASGFRVLASLTPDSDSAWSI